ncbi:MAG: PKD domain-containing protein [Methanomassiliicoccales archaeon]
MDLFVAEEGSSKINIWNYSAGAFTLRTDVVEQESITSLATIDINGDSCLDLVSVSASKHNLTVFRASTTLLYGHPNSLTFPVPYHPVHVVAHDMDSEGTEDLVVSSRSSNGHGAITIYYRNGQEISNADRNRIVKDIAPTLMTLGDFNHDGSNEIAAYDPSGLTLSFISETSLLGRLSAPLGILAMESGDLDGDGYDDIALMSATNVTVWFGSSSIFSDASRQVTVQSTHPGLSSLLLDDLNNDGRPDLTVGGSGGADMFWSSGTGTLYSEAQRFNLSLPGASVTSLATVLVNGTVHNDLRADLVIINSINSTASRIELYYQQTAGSVFTVGSSSYLNEIPGLYQLCTGNLSSDGLGDLAVLSPGKVHVYLQNPAYSGGFSDKQPITVIDVPDGPHQLRLGDLDDDGVLDLALVSENSTLMAYGYDGSSFSLITRQTTGAAPVLLSVGDMNGDGKDDLVAYSAASRSVSFYHQNNFPPIAQANVEGTGHLEANPVWFNANGSTDSYSDRDHLTYHWDFDDGSTANGERVSHVFLANRLYNVTLRVSDSWGGLDDAVVQVLIGDRFPTANFTFQTVPTPVEGSPVTFTDLSTTPVDPIERWEWDFGDGTRSNQTDNQSVQHIFLWNGTFTVTLTVLDSDGNSSSISKQVLMEDSTPTANFSLSITTPLEGQEVGFIDHSTSPADPIVSWRWNFDDGTTVDLATNAIQYHTYTHSGIYNVNLTVEDIDGDVHSMSIAVVVLNSMPTAGFEPSSLNPYEGQQVTFVDESTANPLNPIVYWRWNMGDGTWYNLTASQNIVHTYTNDNTSVVTLTVEDADGDVHSLSRTITVYDTSPTIVEFYTADREDTYNEWDVIHFIVLATPGWEDIDGYEWDFNTDTFLTDNVTEVNNTYHQYNYSGTIRVTVRVYDKDSYYEKSLLLTINDPPPGAYFSMVIDNRTVVFTVAPNLDTWNDLSLLEYRWVFGDGQQIDWSNMTEVEHTYQQDGVYSVHMEVRDDSINEANKTRNVTIDVLPPVISTIGDPVLNADVGKPTLIRVSVYDVVGVRSVWLEYTIDNVTRTLVMTSEGGNSYFAQIPEQNRTMTLNYTIFAEDVSGHLASTERFDLELEYEDQSLFIYSSLALLMTFLAIIIYLFLSRPIVDEVFVLYHDGTLLAHQTRRLKPGMDDEILGGMLIALQSFVRDSFKDENSTVLRRMDFGERKLLVERKDDFFMAVMLSGKRAGNAATRMMKVLNSIEKSYAPVLKEWDGDLEKVRGIRDETKPMFSRANPLDRLKRKEGEDDSI